jgi:cell division inhibitor SepF
MGLKNVWNRALVYFGIAEEDEYWDEEYSAEDSLERSYADRPNVRRLHYARRGSAQEDFDDWSEPEATEPVPVPTPQATSSRPAVLGGRRAARAERAPLEAVASSVPASASQRVHLVIPRSFNDAQSIADKFKESVPVILNLQSADAELAKRLIDFSSGLTYALNGGMQRVADKVFLLTPRNVEVSAEERARMLERGFFNQA